MCSNISQEIRQQDLVREWDIKGNKIKIGIKQNETNQVDKRERTSQEI